MGRKVNRSILAAMMTVELIEQNLASFAIVMEGLRNNPRYVRGDDAIAASSTSRTGSSPVSACPGPSSKATPPTRRRAHRSAPMRPACARTSTPFGG